MLGNYSMLAVPDIVHRDSMNTDRVKLSNKKKTDTSLNHSLIRGQWG
jgi:hypothetical protein